MTARLSAEQRRALELLARDPRGVTGHLLVVAHGFEMKMLAGLADQGLVAAVVGESTKAGGNAIEVVPSGSLPQGEGRLIRDRLRRSRSHSAGYCTNVYPMSGNVRSIPGQISETWFIPLTNAASPSEISDDLSAGSAANTLHT
jgi:hypothetical protein